MLEFKIRYTMDLVEKDSDVRGKSNKPIGDIIEFTGTEKEIKAKVNSDIEKVIDKIEEIFCADWLS